MNIWFTSDTHYQHKNIVRGTTQWADDPTKGAASVQKTRDFDTLEEHNKALVDNINKYVKEDDILWHLGDWSFGGLEQVWEFRKKLNCKNIHLVFGNHDHHIEKNATIKIEPSKENYEILNRLGISYLEEGGYNIDYLITTTMKLFSSVNYYVHRKIGGQDMVMCHYAMRTWNKGHHGTWQLFGHSHGTLPDYVVEYNDPCRGKITYQFRTTDVGVDTHPEFRPYHINELRDKMKDRVPLIVDHHDKTTN